MLAWGCTSGRARPDGEDAGCSATDCAAVCAADGFTSGSCDGGTCVCSPGADVGDEDGADVGVDADAGSCGDDAAGCSEDAPGDSDDDVGDEDGDGVEAEAESDCPCGMCGPDGGPPVLDPDHREGGSPGIVCDRVPIGLSRQVSWYDVAPGTIVFTGQSDGTRYATSEVYRYRTDTGERTVIDDLHDLMDVGVYKPQATNPSLDGDWVAYAVWWHEPPGWTAPLSADLRLAHLVTGEIRILRRYAPGPDGTSTYIDPVSIDYPWVAWRETQDGWRVHALNIETEEEFDVARSTVDVVVEGTLLATESGHDLILFDLLTGTDTRLAAGLPGDRWHPALASPWVVWVDQRDGLWWDPAGSDSQCIWISGCCDNDIYGYNRETGDEVPFVVRHGMQGGQVTADGEWAAYEDHRDGSDELCEDHRPCRQIYALHLTTGVEVRVTNWPGEYLQPVVYSGRVLFSEMTSYAYDLYDLWDCNLVEP
ncbi:MAG: hypothetical protein HY905_21960 [Deltaproteobacteria bacterium]|nr:hypothetical protein [Deltaproteobacteria bacterium]